MLRAGKSKPLRTMMQFVRDEIRLPPGGKFPGERMNLNRQPVQRLLLQEIDRKHWLEIVVAAPSQSAKTWVAFDIPIAYHIAEIREDVVVGIPLGAMINDKWIKEIKPIFEASPALRHLLPNEGPGSKGGKVLDSVRFTNGTWCRFMTRGGSDQSKAGFTARVVCATEAAGWSGSTETSEEADPLEQMSARQRSWEWFERLTIIEGTVTTELSYPWVLQKGSSESRIVSPCPHCKRYIGPEREHLQGWQDCESAIDSAHAAYFVCPECGKSINDRQRKASMAKCVMVHGTQKIDRKGKITGKLPKSRRLWFRWSGWHNLFNSIGSLAVDEWKAAQHPPNTPEWENAEKKQTQFVWAVPYAPPQIDMTPLDAEAIAERSSKLKRGVVPEDTVALTIGVDTGKRVLHWTCMAVNEQGGSRVIDYDKQPVRADEIGTKAGLIEAFGLLADYFGNGWSTAKGRKFLPSQVWIDSGYYEHTNAVYDFCQKINEKLGVPRGADVYRPSKGYGEARRQMTRYIAPEARSKHLLYVGDQFHIARPVRDGRALPVALVHMNSDAWKSVLHQRLAIPSEEPQAITLYDSASPAEHAEFVAHLLAERQISKHIAGKGEVICWDQVARQNHFLDSTYQATCAGAAILEFRVKAQRTSGKQGRTLAQMAEDAKKK